MRQTAAGSEDGAPVPASPCSPRWGGESLSKGSAIDISQRECAGLNSDG